MLHVNFAGISSNLCKASFELCLTKHSNSSTLIWSIDNWLVLVFVTRFGTILYAKSLQFTAYTDNFMFGLYQQNRILSFSLLNAIWVAVLLNTENSHGTEYVCRQRHRWQRCVAFFCFVCNSTLSHGPVGFYSDLQCKNVKIAGTFSNVNPINTSTIFQYLLNEWKTRNAWQHPSYGLLQKWLPFKLSSWQLNQEMSHRVIVIIWRFALCTEKKNEFQLNELRVCVNDKP